MSFWMCYPGISDISCGVAGAVLFFLYSYIWCHALIPNPRQHHGNWSTCFLSIPISPCALNPIHLLHVLGASVIRANGPVALCE